MKKIICSILLLGITLFKPALALAVYEKYIDTIPTAVSITPQSQSVQQELEKRIDEIVTLGHLAPTMYFSGLGSAGLVYYDTPQELIYTLSVAYPYLSPTLKAKVKTYLNTEISSYPPHTVGYYNPHSGKQSDWVGVRRENFAYNPNEGFGIWPGPPVGLPVIYSVWTFANNTNDWTYVTQNYTSWKNIYTTYKAANQTLTSYPDLAGVIAFARIAKKLNNTTDYQDALSYAETGFTAAKDFTSFATNGQIKFPGSNATSIGVFMVSNKSQVFHFNKDLGLFLKEQAKPAVTLYLQSLMKRVPLIWLNEVSFTQNENSFANPEYSWTYFLLNSYVLDTDQSLLKTKLDAPTRKGDLFYIQKLVSVIEAPALVTSSPTPSAQPTPTKVGDIVINNKVDIFDYNALLTDFGKKNDPLTPADLDDDNDVDIFDYNILLTNFGT